MKHKNFGTNMGTSSILMIFIILCLVSFATLSLTSAVAEQKLTAKASEKTASYYQAQNLAQQQLNSLDDELSALYAQVASEEEYFASTSSERNYSITVSDTQTLELTVQVLYPKKAGDPYYAITSFREVTHMDTEDYTSTEELLF